WTGLRRNLDNPPPKSSPVLSFQTLHLVLPGGSVIFSIGDLRSWFSRHYFPCENKPFKIWAWRCFAKSLVQLALMLFLGTRQDKPEKMRSQDVDELNLNSSSMSSSVGAIAPPSDPLAPPLI
ncbi:hypothetical protein AMECASPLE_017133, partial [Ameca splendens]